MRELEEAWVVSGPYPPLRARLETGRVLDRSGRRRVRRAVVRGEAVEGIPDARYAVAYARDLERRRPRRSGPAVAVLLGIAAVCWTLLAISFARDGRLALAVLEGLAAVAMLASVAMTWNERGRVDRSLSLNEAALAAAGEAPGTLDAELAAARPCQLVLGTAARFALVTAIVGVIWRVGEGDAITAGAVWDKGAVVGAILTAVLLIGGRTANRLRTQDWADALGSHGPIRHRRAGRG